MGETSADSLFLSSALIGFLMFFGYLSLALVVGTYLRSQFKIFQKYLIPASIIGGFFLLIIGPEILTIISYPAGGHADLFLRFLVPLIFIIIGLRGHSSGERVKARETLKLTAVVTSTLAFQLIVGAFFTLAIILLINPEFFAGFGSFLMLGQGFDSVLSRFFGGAWEQDLGFTGGKAISFSFSAFGFLAAYLVGVAYIVWARAKGLIKPLPDGEGIPVQTGIVPVDHEKKSAGLLTTHSQSIDTFALHLAVVGFCLLLLYGAMKIVVLLIVKYLPPGMVIAAEVFANFHFLFGLLIGLGVRKLMVRFKIDYIVDSGVLNRLLGITVDYMVVAAIVSIPLVISRNYPWEILLLSLGGAVLTLFAVKLLLARVYRDSSLDSQVALYGLLTGNISSALALLRMVDPDLQRPLSSNLAYVGGLSFIAAAPLFFLMVIPLFGTALHLLMAAGLALAYGVLLFLVWRFVIDRRTPAKEE